LQQVETILEQQIEKYENLKGNQTSKTNNNTNNNNNNTNNHSIPRATYLKGKNGFQIGNNNNNNNNNHNNNVNNNSNFKQAQSLKRQSTEQQSYPNKKPKR